MVEGPIHTLPGRGVVALSGLNARAWLDNLVSNDLTVLDASPVVFSALLSPQGKVLFEFFVFKSGDVLLLDVAADMLDGFTKRLKLYKLRAKLELVDVSADWSVVWGVGTASAGVAGGIVASDPRQGGLWRGLYPRADLARVAGQGPYVEERVRLGIAEAPLDYALGDVFPHEANYDLMHGVSFTKGCYVGQEVVSRMQNKTVVRKRVVRISAAVPLTAGADVVAGVAVVGRVGSTSGHEALAMLRLDRAVEAVDAGVAIQVGGQAIDVDAAALARYRQSVKDRPVIDL